MYTYIHTYPNKSKQIGGEIFLGRYKKTTVLFIPKHSFIGIFHFLIK